MTRISGKSIVLLVTLGVFAALAAAPADAQNVRPSVQVDVGTAVPAYTPSVDSDGDLSAIVYNADITKGIWVVTSDGRGIDWTAPVRVDEDPVGFLKYTQYDSCVVVDNHIYAAWEDERNGTTNEDIYFNYSTDGGATWMGEAWVDKGYPAGTGVVRDWRLHVSGLHVYFLLTVDPTGMANEELYLVASHDGGLNFQAPVHIPQDFAPGAFDIEMMEMAANGLTVHVAWQDDRGGSGSNLDVFYQKSIDGGATWNASDIQLDSSGPGVGDANGEMSVVAMGNGVAVGWQEELTHSAYEEIRVNVSTNGGVTWNGDVMVGNYNPALYDADGVWLALGNRNGTITLACTWCDISSGAYEAYAAASLDAGATWPNVTQLSTAGATKARFPRIDEIPDSLAITFISADNPNRAEGAFSNDGGVTWTTVQTSTTIDDTDHAEIAFNVDYNNVICAWLSDDLGSYNMNNVYTGGYRPQTLTLNGTFTAGSLVNFEISNWPTASGNPTFGVFASGSLGNYMLAQGPIRNSGLTWDAYTNACISQMPGVCSDWILPGGTGSTMSFPFPATIPVGTTLYFVALGLDGTTTPITLGALTDIVTVVVQ